MARIRKATIFASSVGISLLLLLGNPCLLRASDKPAVQFTSSVSSSLSGPNTEGWAFRAAQNSTVVAFGFWDFNGDGLTASHEVGIWDSEGSLLRTATVTTAGVLRDGFRYVGVEPLQLRTGATYTIGAVQVTGTPDALATIASGFNPDPLITFLWGARGSGAGKLVQPTVQQPAVDPGYFGPSFLLAGPCVCNGFDTSRAGDWSVTGGTHFSRLRSRLTDAALFGPTGRASHAIALAAGLPTLTAGGVAGIDLFFTGWTPTTTYSDLERVELVNLVKRGMNLVATLDDTQHNIADLFGVTLRNGGNVSHRAALPDQPVFAGPFGRVTRFQGAGPMAHFVSWPDDAQVLATNELGQATILMFVPGTGGLPAESGTVLLLADTDILTTFGRTLEADSSTPDIPVTDAFALNVVAHLCNRWAPATAPDLVFAQIANGAGNVSEMNVSNAGAAAAQVSWKFFSDAGAVLPVATGSGTVSSVVASVRPNATAPSIVTDGKQGGAVQPVSGWASVSGSPSLTGNVIFAIPGIGATSVGAGELAGGFLVPIVPQPTPAGTKDIYTGLAVANFSPKAASVRLEIWDSNGQRRADGVTTIALPASGHTARFLYQLFPSFNFSGFTGSLRVISLDGLISVTGLQLGSQPGEFTALPAKALYR